MKDKEFKEKCLGIIYIFKHLSKGCAIEVSEKEMTQQIMHAFLFVEEKKMGMMKHSQKEGIYVLLPDNYKKIEELLGEVDPREIVLSAQECLEDEDFDEDLINYILEKIQRI